MLLGSAQTRRIALEGPAAGVGAVLDCALATALRAHASNAYASALPARVRCAPTKALEASRLLAAVESVEMPGFDLAISATFQVGIQAFPVIHHHFTRAKRRHSFLGAP